MMMKEMTIEQPVTVGHGDLMVVLAAAEATAGGLRRRAAALPKGHEKIMEMHGKADMIDKSIHALRAQSYETTRR